mgnify:CR=1 FL=1
MIAAFGGWLLKRATSGFLDKALAAYRQKLDAGTATDRIAADVAVETVKAEIEARKVAAEIVRVEQGWWVTALIRPMFVLPLLIWWWAVILDSIFLFGWKVAALPGQVGEWAGWIVAAYFGGRTLEKIARGWKR